MTKITKRDVPEILALCGLMALIVAIALFNGDAQQHVISRFDIATLLLPFALLLGLPLLRKRGFEDQPFFPIGFCAVIFLLWVLVSMLFVVSEPMVFLTWGRYACYFLFIPIVGLLASEQRTRTMLYTLLVGVGAAVSLYALYQYFAPSNPGAQYAAGDISRRVFATFGNPNSLGEILLTPLAATVALFGSLKAKGRYALGLIFLLEVAALFLTYSRASLLAFFVGTLFGILLINWKAIIPAAVLTAIPTLFVPHILERIRDSFVIDASAEGRLIWWKAAIQSGLQSPVFGKGMLRVLRATAPKSLAIYKGYFNNDSHNSYIQMFAESGIPGLILFICIIGSFLWGAIYLSRRIKDNVSLSIQNAALAGGIAAYAVNAFFESAFQHPRPAVYFLVMVGLMIGLGSGYWRKDEVALRDPHNRLERWWQNSAARTLIFKTLSPVDVFAESKIARLFITRYHHKQEQK